MEEVECRNVRDLLYNPFFLVHLVNIYKADRSLPARRTDIFESIIAKRFENDREKYINASVNIDAFKGRIFLGIERLALAVGCLGRKHVTEAEFQRVIDDSTNVDLIKYSFLFNKKEPSGNNQIWEFEHNNFQEYLAAKKLAQLSIPDIKALTFFRHQS